MATPLRIALLLFPQCMPAGLFAFADLLNAANRRAGKSLFDCRFVALQAGPLECAQGLTLDVTTALEPRELDAILLPGFWAESAQQVEAAIEANAALIAALAKSPRRLQLWSYCAGVSLLAASGRLHEQPATITWWLTEAMTQAYPQVRWQSERSCVVNPGNATAAGVNGYLPIAQALIEQRLSPDALNDLIKLMVLPRPAQSHRAFQTMSLIEQPSTLLRRLHALVERTPAEQITTLRLAEQLGLSERTLARKVSRETGVAVAAYARCIKLNQVSERLTLTSVSVSRISQELGFSSDSNMRRMFKELTALTPLEYRQRFARY